LTPPAQRHPRLKGQTVPDDRSTIPESVRVERWARRQSDVHAGLAAERLQDLVERLRRLSSALSLRGDDLTAGMLDDQVLRLSTLRMVLEDLEADPHQTERMDRKDDPQLGRLVLAGRPTLSDDDPPAE
jgi:hypothetical protein